MPWKFGVDAKEVRSIPMNVFGGRSERRRVGVGEAEDIRK